METLTSHIIPTESRAIASLVKEEILNVDATAAVILFGSRARGDAENESDWDFLVLTQKKETELLAEKLRKIMLRNIELNYDVSISLIVKNVSVWENKYSVTNIYRSIFEEGILL